MGKLVRNSRIGLAIFFVVVGVFGAFSEEDSSILVMVLAVLISFGVAYAFLPGDLKEIMKSRVFKGYRPKEKTQKEPVAESPVEVEEPVTIQKQRVSSPDLERWDQLSDREFISHMTDFLRENGYDQVQLTKDGSIVGVKNQDTYLFRCQRSDQTVPVAVVHELIANSRDFESSQLVAITNDYFSDEAIEFAAETNVKLWNRDTLSKLIMFYRK
ncbi:restriction endonuclease [uncultured Vagococcus sp.]|uniref:restriction endonuclease n=1 Tax=uncultured Vagococcus sp. TaxID=189676 RepID=UPI0028D52FEF|nr:restriction endonuclease [uncultured Vagococcus sp.]